MEVRVTKEKSTSTKGILEIEQSVLLIVLVAGAG